MKKIAAGATTLVALGMALPAAAEDAVVEIDVTVEEIAVLDVIRSQGSMVIDDDSDTFMGNPSSGGSVFSGEDLAVIRLSTNYDVNAIEVDFDRLDGFRQPDSSTYFGVATGTTLGNTLGVWPQIANWDNDTQNIPSGGSSMTTHSGSDEPLTHDTGAPFGNGQHYFALGVSTNWDRTLLGEPEFAAPDTYNIELTATVIPD
ncbi:MULTISPECIES: hypothetical protein [Halorhodospira]|uniref:hypothetical protein n=1 Tax=Halorhodospira TaxID=85108 RepID=UPI001EE97CBE|nr:MULTISPECIES: hypothetical protein [Halorhodospira]MCG5527332.1 hypothetical protein [Halorhodospira halophila]MCG5543674.1 hypothetical protein [Halorhodospira sp. 9628]